MKTFAKVTMALAGALIGASVCAQDSVRVKPQPRLSETVQKRPTASARPLLRLPDLRPTAIIIQKFGGEIVVNVDVANVGNADSPATSNRTILVTAPILNPLTGQAWYPPGSNVAQSQALWNSLPAIPAGQTKRVYLGAARLPNTTQDWDIAFETYVDVPPAGQPRGQILESNENNNTLYRQACRIGGPNPRPGGPPAC